LGRVRRINQEAKEKLMLKIGVIGAGHLGKFHLNNWMEMEGVEVVGFCDTDDANAASVEEKYKLKRFASPDELLDHCDAVDIVALLLFILNCVRWHFEKESMFL
jgi:predicted homoserine dehydrogenase-like protein